MEAGSTAFEVARAIESVPGVRVVVLNPGRLAVIYASMKKTDKEDALKLARLVETMPEDYLPTVTIPSVEEEEMKRHSGGAGVPEARAEPTDQRVAFVVRERGAHHRSEEASWTR